MDSQRLTPADRREASRVVVVADDDEAVRDMLAELLEMHGFIVHPAANGLEAILAIKQVHPAAVVLDLLMPRLGGLEALNRIRALAPTLRVVVVTGSDDPDLRHEALVLGATAVLRKPLVTYDALLHVLSGPAPVSHDALAGAALPVDQGAGRSVLVVDDEPDVRGLLSEFLGDLGYTPQTAADGEEAIRLVRESRPPVMLLDIVMPGLGGIEALVTIRGISPETRVIMVSALADVTTARRTLAYGAFDYVAKPVNLHRLGEVVKAAFTSPWL